ncbi:MAG: PAS domain S-box protein, partial [Gammaproteobacteria bacterium]|nr:PAS domain S-box protein [Gammaproteobacteria bacterium]
MGFKRYESIYHITIPVGLVTLWLIETIQIKVVHSSFSLIHYLAPTLVGISIGLIIGFIYSLRARYKLQSEQFRDIADVAQEFIFLRRLDGHYEYASPSCLNITGYNSAEFYATPNLMDQLIHEDDLGRWKNHVHRINKGSQPENFDIRIISKSGDVVWINHICLPTYDAAGEQTGVRSTNLNITDRKIQEEKLCQASILYNNTTEAVVITEPQGTVVATNMAFTTITGYSEEEVIGKKPSYWKSNRHEQDFYQTMWHELLETDQWRGEIWNRRKSGELYPALLTINSVRNEKKQLTHYVSILTDISTIKQSQEKVEFLAHHDSLTELPNRL